LAFYENQQKNKVWLDQAYSSMSLAHISVQPTDPYWRPLHCIASYEKSVEAYCLWFIGKNKIWRRYGITKFYNIIMLLILVAVRYSEGKIIVKSIITEGPQTNNLYIDVNLLQAAINRTNLSTTVPFFLIALCENPDQLSSDHNKA
jgi:hypothetical protein